MKLENKEDKEIEDIVNQVGELKQSEALNKVLLKLLKNNNQETMRLWFITLFLIIFSLFMIVFLQLSNMAQQDKFIAEQDKYLRFLKEFDYEVEIVEEGQTKTTEDKTVNVKQECDGGCNVVQTGNNSTYNE